MVGPLPDIHVTARQDASRAIRVLSEEPTDVVRRGQTPVAMIGEEEEVQSAF